MDPLNPIIPVYLDVVDSIVTREIDLTSAVYNRGRKTDIIKIVKPCLARETKIVSVNTISLKVNNALSFVAKYNTITVIMALKDKNSVCFKIKRNGEVLFEELTTNPISNNLKNSIKKMVDDKLAELFCFDRSYVVEVIEDIAQQSLSPKLPQVYFG